MLSMPRICRMVLRTAASIKTAKLRPAATGINTLRIATPVSYTHLDVYKRQGLANAEQILTSKQAIDELPQLLRESTRDLDQLTVKGKAQGVHVFEVLWRPTEELTMKADSIGQLMAGASVSKLCLRYRGRAYLMDEKTTQFTLGRELTNDLVVEDRKASRLSLIHI